MTAATNDDWIAFLRPLVASVRNPPDREDFRAKVAAVAFGLPDIPTELLTPQRSREALRRYDFWPSVAELATWLAPIAAEGRYERRIRAERAALPPPTPKREHTEAERQAARETARAFAADMAALNAPRAVAVTSKPVSDEHLLIGYEKLAAELGPNSAAATRAASLRAKVEANRQ